MATRPTTKEMNMEYWNFYYDDEYRDELDIIEINAKTIEDAGDKADEHFALRCEEEGIVEGYSCITFVKFDTESDDILETVTGLVAEYQDFDFNRDCGVPWEFYV
jgi:hypothetical protein